MLLAKIVCSDPDCPEEAEVAIDHVRELEGRVCECGFGFVLMQISELRRPGGEVIAIATRREAPSQRRAA
ncbi:MAG: hypothetical protein ACRDL6_05535 [Solirubrobacterales bacterium]